MLDATALIGRPPLRTRKGGTPDAHRDHNQGDALDIATHEGAVLEKKARRLGGFDAAAFRQDILRYLEVIARQ